MSAATDQGSLHSTDEVAMTRLALIDRNANVFGYELRQASRLPAGSGQPKLGERLLADYVARVAERNG